MKKRVKYLLTIIVIIILGLLTRKVAVIPSCTGDALYALMMFFIIRFIFLRRTTMFAALLNLVICFAIEFSQLYQAGWINNIRATLPGRLILGQGFLWSDLIAYAAGVLCGIVIEKAGKKFF